DPLGARRHHVSYLHAILLSLHHPRLYGPQLNRHSPEATCVARAAWRRSAAPAAARRNVADAAAGSVTITSAVKSRDREGGVPPIEGWPASPVSLGRGGPIMRAGNRRPGKRRRPHRRGCQEIR